MYLGNQEIESIDNNIVTLKSGATIEIEEKNKELFTEEAITGSDLQMNFASLVASEIVDVLFANNVRLTDINLIINLVNEIISGKNDEAIVKAFGKEKLDALSTVFGATENAPSISARNIRMKEIFNT